MRNRLPPSSDSLPQGQARGGTSDPAFNPGPTFDPGPAQRRSGPPDWPRPPSALPHHWLNRPPEGARVTVAGLVMVRQRPGTAHGVVFITLEDETGIANVIVWRNIYEKFRRAVVAGRALRVTGKVQRESGVAHVIADTVEDISWMLDTLARPPAAQTGAGADRD